ncbi:MAG: hypothetical protein VB997_05940 [Opitutales bacterium]
MSNFSEWRLDWSWPLVAVIAVAMAICLRLCILTWIRSGKRKSVAWLEALRFMTVALLLLTLANPERVERIERDSEPEVLLFTDISGSMSTRDATDANGTILTRGEWVAKSLAQPWRAELEKTAIVTEHPFSSANGPDATDLSLPLQEGLDRTPNLKATLYFTDGDGNTGSSPLSLAGRCRAGEVPAYVIRVGSEKPLPDLALEDFTAPSFALRDERLTVTYRVRNAFPHQVETTLELSANGEAVAAKPLILPAGDEVSGSLSWLPTMEGEVSLRAEIGLHAGESILDNNVRELKTRIESKVLKALIVDSFPRWEYRFLRNALERDPRVDMNCILLHPGMKPGDGRGYLREFPGTPEELAPYDVVFLGDVGLGEGELSEEACESLANLVRLQASGVVFLPGRRGRQPSLVDSALGDLIPVTFDPAKPRGLGTTNTSAITLTSKGRNHWLTTLRGSGEPDVRFWERLPGFQWSAAALKSRPGSEVLAVHSIFRNDWGRMPVLVIRYVGAGKTLYLGSDAAWRWRRGVEDKYHYRFWSQVARWMAHGRHLSEGDGMRVIPSPERPKAGENVYLRCIVMDKDGFPLEEGPVEGSVEHPGGESEQLIFEPDPEGDGVFLTTFRTRQPGSIALRTEAPKADRFLQTTLQVESHGLERLGRSARWGDLRELALLTNGKFGLEEDLESIVQTINALPDPSPLERIHRLRADLNWGLFLCALLAFYWTGRKFTGMI